MMMLFDFYMILCGYLSIYIVCSSSKSIFVPRIEVRYGRSDVRMLKDEKSKDEIRSKQSYGGFRMMARSLVALCRLCGIGCPLY